MGFSRSKCKSATKRYRATLKQINRLNIEAPEACKRLKDVAPSKYKDCMDSLAKNKKLAADSRKVIRLQMQRSCKRSVSARVAGTKYAPEFSAESLLNLPLNEMLSYLEEEQDMGTRIAINISQRARRNGARLFHKKAFHCGRGMRDWSEKTQLRKDRCLERARWRALVKAKQMLEKGIQRCKAVKAASKVTCRNYINNDIQKLDKEITFSRDKARQIERELKGGR